MRARVLAWVVLAVVLFGVYKGVQAWRNPWSMPSAAAVSPVLSNLPASPAGCGEKCRD